jgi:hypothetical protein
MDSEAKRELTFLVKRLIRQKDYLIDPHTYQDYPEREIGIDDILEVLKTGEIEGESPKIDASGLEKYRGEQRYIWYRMDIKDRVLRLIIKIKNGLLVISAAHPSEQKSAEIKKRFEE